MLTVAALALFTLLCITLSDDLAWDNLTRSTRNDLVFQDRHRGYGAFVLRRDYDRRFVIAFLAALGLLESVLGLAYAFVPDRVRAATKQVLIVDRILDPTVYEATKATEPKKAASDPAPKPIPPTPPAPGKDPGLVEAGTAVDSVRSDVHLRVDTMALGGGEGKGPRDPGPGAGGEPKSGGGPLGNDDPPKEIADVDVQPEFPGGYAKMMEYVQRHIRFPESDGRKQKVFVQFVVDTDGNVLSVVTRGAAPDEYATAAVEVVRNMPKWNPAQRKGHKVACRLVLPISFETK